MKPFRGWALAVSILLHAVALGGSLAVIDDPQPNPLPQIELLLPEPVPPQPEEAAPSPAAAQLSPRPVESTMATSPVDPPLPRPIVTTNHQADRTETRRLPDRRSQRPVPETPADTEPRHPVAAQEASALPITGDKTGSNVVLGDASPTTHPAGPPPDYLGLIRNRLERAKRYPAAAREDGQEGVIKLSFTLARSGHLLGWRIAHGSGFAALDQATVDMLQRAAPFPPFPDEYTQPELRLSVPVEFSLRDP